MGEGAAFAESRRDRPARRVGQSAHLSGVQQRACAPAARGKADPDRHAFRKFDLYADPDRDLWQLFQGPPRQYRDGVGGGAEHRDPDPAQFPLLLDHRSPRIRLARDRAGLFCAEHRPFRGLYHHLLPGRQAARRGRARRDVQMRLRGEHGAILPQLRADPGSFPPPRPHPEDPHRRRAGHHGGAAGPGALSSRRARGAPRRRLARRRCGRAVPALRRLRRDAAARTPALAAVRRLGGARPVHSLRRGRLDGGFCLVADQLAPRGARRPVRIDDGHARARAQSQEDPGRQTDRRCQLRRLDGRPRRDQRARGAACGGKGVRTRHGEQPERAASRLRPRQQASHPRAQQRGHRARAHRRRRHPPRPDPHAAKLGTLSERNRVDHHVGGKYRGQRVGFRRARLLPRRDAHRTARDDVQGRFRRQGLDARNRHRGRRRDRVRQGAADARDRQPAQQQSQIYRSGRGDDPRRARRRDRDHRDRRHRPRHDRQHRRTAQ